MNRRECGIQTINDLAKEFSLSPDESDVLCELLLMAIIDREGAKGIEYARLKLQALQDGGYALREAVFEFERRLFKKH